MKYAMMTAGTMTSSPSISGHWKFTRPPPRSSTCDPLRPPRSRRPPPSLSICDRPRCRPRARSRGDAPLGPGLCPPRSSVNPQMLRQAATRRELAAALAQVGEAQDRIDQVVVGRKLERVDTGDPERRAHRLLAALRRVLE